MMVILRENIENLGIIGDIVKVSDGYARNYLLPRNLVVIADEQNKAAIEHHRKSLEKRRLALKAAATEAATKLGNFTVTLQRKVGEGDKLFGSVTANDIADALHAGGFTSVDKRGIQIDNAIKTAGNHTVTVKLGSDVTATVKVSVVKEG